jgi:hypothetical protein
MATSTFVHSDDDGAVSVFIRGTGGDSEILFVCEHRHWWTADIADAGSAGKASVKRAAEGKLAESTMKADKPLVELSAKFGDGVYRAMRFK